VKERPDGCLQRQSHIGQWLPEYGTTEDCPLVPVEQWVSQEAKRWLEWGTIDQNGYPACCLAATCHAMQLVMALRNYERIALDWLKAWKKLSGGSGGVAIDVALREAMQNGIPRADGQGTVKITEAWDTRDIKAYFSGLRRGGIGVFGAQGHAECNTSVIVAGSDYSADTLNSWGQDWGEKGWHKTSYSKLAGGLPYYGAFLIRDVEIVGTETALINQA
jgi:hypothetical protein